MIPDKPLVVNSQFKIGYNVPTVPSVSPSVLQQCSHINSECAIIVNRCGPVHAEEDRDLICPFLPASYQLDVCRS